MQTTRDVLFSEASRAPTAAAVDAHWLLPAANAMTASSA